MSAKRYTPLGHLLDPKLTSRLLSGAFADGARVLQVDVPAVGLAGGVLEVEGKDGLALRDGVLLVGIAGESGADRIEGGRGRELG